MFVNLTPHEIKLKVQVEVHDPVQNQNQNLTQIDGPFALLRIPPEPVSARVSTIKEIVELIKSDGLIVTVRKHTFKQIEGLPEPKPDTIYIVSGMVRDVLDGRPDVLAPDTGKTSVRNQRGQVASVARLRGKYSLTGRSMFIVQSEHDGDIFVAVNAISPLEAIECGRQQGMLGVLNAVQVQDQVQALDRIRAAVEFVLDTFGPTRVPFCLPDADIRRVTTEYIVTDFHVGRYSFTYYPATGEEPWRVCNT